MAFQLQGQLLLPEFGIILAVAKFQLLQGGDGGGDGGGGGGGGAAAAASG